MHESRSNETWKLTYSRQQLVREPGQVLSLEEVVENKRYKRKVFTKDGFVEGGILKVLEVYPKTEKFLVEIYFKDTALKREEKLSNYGIIAIDVSGVKMYYNSAYLVPEQIQKY